MVLRGKCQLNVVNNTLRNSGEITLSKAQSWRAVLTAIFHRQLSLIGNGNEFVMGVFAADISIA